MLSYEKKVFSQNGEDGILEYLDQFVNGPRTFLEIGWAHGVQNCCRHLMENLVELFVLHLLILVAHSLRSQF